jgi:hypothetical protein
MLVWQVTASSCDSYPAQVIGEAHDILTDVFWLLRDPRNHRPDRLNELVGEFRQIMKSAGVTASGGTGTSVSSDLIWRQSRYSLEALLNGESAHGSQLRFGEIVSEPLREVIPNA